MRGERDGHMFCARVAISCFSTICPAGWRGPGSGFFELSAFDYWGQERTDRVLSDELREAAYGAWTRARQDIFDEWTVGTIQRISNQRSDRFQTCSANCAKFAPQGMDQATIDNVASSLEAPWGGRIELKIREALGEVANAEAAKRVIDAVKDLGLTPYEAPEPLPPIEIGEVSLVCWMAVTKAI